MNIRKRKKGDKFYFYLEHNKRKGEKIIKKEKYLGTTIPKDINKIKIEFLNEIKLELYKKLENIKKNFQKEWKKTPKSAKENQIEEISVEFTYNTNAIEGSTISLSEVRQIIKDKIAPNKPLRDIKETEYHNKVFIQIIKNKQKITNTLLLNWHKEIFGETKVDIAGKYREYFVRVGSYIAPNWKEVKKMMNSLISFIEKNKDINPVELAARAHYKFESIHPFGDGNGRIGRLLMNHILWHRGYPILSIEYKKRNSYYNAFPKGEEKFVNYFIRRYLAVHKRLV